MKKSHFKVPEPFRLSTQTMPSNPCDGYGLFKVHGKKSPGIFWIVVATDGKATGWEHVSVVKHNGGILQTPTWDEMCLIKGLFWDEQATVVQFHPAKENYVNNHKNCLHLWCCTNKQFPTPPTVLVGL